MRAYWFSDNGIVTNESGRHEFHVGKTYSMEGEIIPCVRGFHGSEHPFDALGYTQADSLDLVELAGTIVPHGDPVDKHAASQRTHIVRINATDILLAFARWCALQVVHLWTDADAVRQYLTSGNPAFHDAAWRFLQAHSGDIRPGCGSASAKASAEAAMDFGVQLGTRFAAEAARFAARYAVEANVLDAGPGWGTTTTKPIKFFTLEGDAWRTTREAQRADFLARVEPAFTTTTPEV